MKYIKNNSWCHECGYVVNDDTKKKISIGLKKYLQTDEGKKATKKSHTKRSKTMKKIRDKIRLTITEKKCFTCSEVKPINSFNKKSAAKDGLQTNCKICVNIIKQQWRKKVKENKIRKP